MSLSSAIESSIEKWSAQWSKRLHNFTSGVIKWGIEQLLDVLGQAASPIVSPMLNKIEQTATIPPELKPFFDEIKSPKGEISSVFATQAGGAIVGGAIGKVLDAIFLPFSYEVNKKLHPALPSEQQLIAVWLRKEITDEDLTDYLKSLGANDVAIETMKSLSSVRFDAATVTKAWLRNKETYEPLWKDLEDVGVSKGRIAILKQLADVLPNAQDVIRFAVREVYSPKIAERFGQFEDFPEDALADASKIGISRETLSKYWAAHWELPGVQQGFEMLHRGAIDDKDLNLLLKALDVMPFWRDKLTKISYSPYTRVDARRMWDLGVLDDKELKQSYVDIGYDDKHADTMVLWTKIYQTFPDLIARYKNGYINLEDVNKQLLAFGLSQSRVNFLIETKVKPEQPARIAKEKDLTKSEILKGLFKGVISEVEVVGLLKDMGYDDNEIEIIIAINAPADESKKAKAAKELSKTDIIKALQVGQITEEEATSRLVNVRFILEDAKFLVALAIATKKAPSSAKVRELTKADIVTGVKKGIITAEQGYIMLQDIGYTSDSANFILSIISLPTGGSPDSFSEFKSLTQSYRKALGLPQKDVPLDLINAERDLKAADVALNEMKARKASSDELIPYQKAVSEAQYKYNRMLSEYRGGK